MKKLFCILCGKEEGLYTNLCESCFRKKNKLASIPLKIKIYKCPHCSAINYKKKWIQDLIGIENILMYFINFNDEATATKIILNDTYDNEEMKLSNPALFLEFYKQKKDVKFRVLGKIKELNFEEVHSTEIIIKNNSCDVCSKKFGDYHEAIIQLRAKDRNLDKIEIERAREIVNYNISNIQLKDREAFVTKEKETKKGIDFYISTSNTANILSNIFHNEFGGTHSKSPKLMGRKDGREIYRVTYLVRMPNYRLGDFIVFDKQIYRIYRTKQKNVIIKDLKGIKSHLKSKDNDNIKILGNEDILIDAMVISQSEKEVQILDPDNYKTIDVLKPIEMEFKIGETVKLLKYNDDVFIYQEF